MNITNKDKNSFVKQAVKIASVEKPGEEFIPSLMSKIEGINLEKSNQLKISPLISWKGWFFIGTIVITIFTLVYSFDPIALNFSFFDVYIDRLNSINISISVSKIFLTGLFAFVFFFIIQISLSANKLNERESI